MSNDKKSLGLTIKRVRTRVAASIRTGSGVESYCPGRTDPTINGGVPCGNGTVAQLCDTTHKNTCMC
jgi:hypothetical protein